MINTLRLPKTSQDYDFMISAYFSLFQPMVLQAANQQDLCDLPQTSTSRRRRRHEDGKALHQSLQQNHGLRHLENLTILLELSNAIHTGSLCKYHCRNSLSFSGRIFSECCQDYRSDLDSWRSDLSRLRHISKRNGQFQIEIGSFVSKPLIVCPTRQIRAKKTSHPSHPRHPTIQSIFGGCCDAIDIYRCYLPTMRAEVFFLLICDITIICDMETHGKSKY